MELFESRRETTVLLNAIADVHEGQDGLVNLSQLIGKEVSAPRVSAALRARGQPVAGVPPLAPQRCDVGVLPFASVRTAPGGAKGVCRRHWQWSRPGAVHRSLHREGHEEQGSGRVSRARTRWRPCCPTIGGPASARTAVRADQ